MAPPKPAMSKHKSFKTQSALDASAPHGAMGAAAVLDGCPIHDDFKNVCLLIIDPQNDFMEGGSLAVTGAKADTERAVALLQKHGEQIDRIVVTLDTHHQMHIAHGSFWRDANGAVPQPFTPITAEDITKGAFAPVDPELKDWALEYATKLEAQGKYTICIWPEHCLIGSPGHAVYKPLADALHFWSAKRSRAITWVLKGQNNLTEMYSALKAEVVRDDDPATRMNTQLIDTLAKHSQVVICGQAKSHCVSYTARDLLSCWPKGREADLVLLSDATSPVAGCDKEGDALEADMKAGGVTVLKCAEYVAKTSA